MLLYHGSNTLCIAVLEPRLADHDSSCIYLTVNPVVAAFYLSNAVEHLYYWFPYKKIGFREYGRSHESYRLHGQWHDWIEMEILEQWWREVTPR